MWKILFFVSLALGLCTSDYVYASWYPVDDVPEIADAIIRPLPNGYCVVSSPVMHESLLEQFRLVGQSTETLDFFILRGTDLSAIALALADISKRHFMQDFLLIGLNDSMRLEEFQVEREFLEMSFPKIASRFEDIAVIPSTPADKDLVISELDSTYFMKTVRQLSGNLGFPLNGVEVKTPTRYTYSKDILKSAAFISNHFQGLGYETIVQNFSMSSTTAQNIIGIKRGTKYPDQIIVVGAHYDSTSGSASTNAPGAIDNASGSAGMMTLADALSVVSSDKTIHFVAFSGEEQGLYGSAFYVKNAIANKWNIESALIMDMISYSNQYFGILVEGTKSFKSLMNVVESNLKAFGGKDFGVDVTTNSWGSDHVSFQKANIPAILLIELDETNYFAYHKTTDVWTNVNEDQSMGCLRGLAGSVCDLAGCNTQ